MNSDFWSKKSEDGKLYFCDTTGNQQYLSKASQDIFPHRLLGALIDERLQKLAARSGASQEPEL